MGLVFWIIPIAILFGSILGSYFVGGVIELIAVFLAFIGGVFMDTIGIWFLVAGLLLGFFAPDTK